MTQTRSSKVRDRKKRPNKWYQDSGEGEILFCQGHQERLSGIWREPCRYNFSHGPGKGESIQKKKQHKQRKAQKQKSIVCIQGTLVWLDCTTRLAHKQEKGEDQTRQVIGGQIAGDPKNPLIREALIIKGHYDGLYDFLIIPTGTFFISTKMSPALIKRCK